MKLHILTTALLTVLLSIGAAPSVSAQDSEQVQERIKVDDLNLHSPQGMQTFHSRVQAAASSICGSTGAGVRNLEALTAERACRAQVIRGGDSQIAAMLAQQDAAQRSAYAARAATPSHAIPYRQLRHTSHRASTRRRHSHATRRRAHAKRS